MSQDVPHPRPKQDKALESWFKALFLGGSPKRQLLTRNALGKAMFKGIDEQQKTAAPSNNLEKRKDQLKRAFKAKKGSLEKCAEYEVPGRKVHPAPDISDGRMVQEYLGYKTVEDAKIEQQSGTGGWKNVAEIHKMLPSSKLEKRAGRLVSLEKSAGKGKGFWKTLKGLPKAYWETLSGQRIARAEHALHKRLAKGKDTRKALDALANQRRNAFFATAGTAGAGTAAAKAITPSRKSRKRKKGKV